METLPAVTRLVANLALGLWLGAMVFFSFVAAPRVFAVLDGEDAGRVVDDIFPRYYAVGQGLGVVALLAGLATGLLHQFDAFLLVFFLTVTVATTATVYARWVLIPKMDAAGDDGFAQYHTQSVVLNAVSILGVAVGFTAMHF